MLILQFRVITRALHILYKVYTKLNWVEIEIHLREGQFLKRIRSTIRQSHNQVTPRRLDWLALRPLIPNNRIQDSIYIKRVVYTILHLIRLLLIISTISVY